MTRLVVLLTLVVLLVIVRRERPDYRPLPRHRDPAICHAPRCRWTPQHPEECDCPETRGA